MAGHSAAVDAAVLAAKHGSLLDVRSG